MSKNRSPKDRRQQSFDFETPIREYENLRVKLISPPERRNRVENYAEACIEIAATVKAAQRASGLKREQLLKEVNAYFGPTKRGAPRFSSHMFNHYLSKPAEYPMPAVLIFAIQHITGSLETISRFAQAEDARVISGEEVRKLAIGKLDDAIAEMQRLKKEFRGMK